MALVRGKKNGDCFIIPHTAREAQLYKYIKQAKSETIFWLGNDSVDCCFLYEPADFDTPPDAATRTLEIDTGYTAFELREPCGSIVYRIEDYLSRHKDEDYLSLYKFLMSLCSSTHLNVMAYGTIYITSYEVLCYDTMIRFHHGKEADRFFLKMYMEAIKDN